MKRAALYSIIRMQSDTRPTVQKGSRRDAAVELGEGSTRCVVQHLRLPPATLLAQLLGDGESGTATAAKQRKPVPLSPNCLQSSLSSGQATNVVIETENNSANVFSLLPFT